MHRLLEIAAANAIVAALLGVMALVALYGCRRPAVAHGLWLLALVKLLTPPFVDVPIAGPQWMVGGLTAPRHESTEARRHDGAASGTAARGSGTAEDGRATRGERGGVERTLGTAGELKTSHVQPAAGFAVAGESGVEPRPMVGDAHPTGDFAAADALSRGLGLRDRGVSATAILVGIWLVGSVVTLGVIVSRLVRFNRLLRFAAPADDQTLHLAQFAASRLGLSYCPPVMLVPGAVSPMLWAFARRPCLLLPRELWLRLDEAGQLSLITHELAHYRRRDHWVRCLELAVAVLYWWHPIVWLAGDMLRQAEEECCDAWVVRTWPGQARSYATALVDTVDFVAQSCAPALPGASGAGRATFKQLKRRITMIVKSATARPSLSSGARLLILSLGLLLLPALPRLTARAAGDGEGGRDGVRNPQRDSRGLIQSIDGTTLVLSVGEAGREIRVATDEETKFFIDGAAGKLSGLKPGMMVSVRQSEGLTTAVEARSPREGARVRDGDAPKDGARREGNAPKEGARRDGDAPREGVRRDGDAPREGVRRDGEAPREGVRRDGDAPREGVRRDGDAPREGVRRDGDAPREGARRDGDAPREGVRRDGDAPREGVRRDGEAPREGVRRDGDAPREGARREGDVRRAAEEVGRVAEAARREGEGIRRVGEGEGAVRREGDRPMNENGDRPRTGAERGKEGARRVEGEPRRVEGEPRRVEGEPRRVEGEARRVEGDVRRTQEPRRAAGEGEPRRGEGEARLRIQNRGGRITEVDGLTVVIGDAREPKPLRTDSKTRVWIDGQAAELTDLKPGMYVIARQVQDVITEIDARTAGMDRK